MPKDASDLMQRQIAQGSNGIDEVIESLSQVDSEEAKAWKMEDEIKVKLITQRDDSMCIRFFSRFNKWISVATLACAQLLSTVKPC